MLTGTQVRVRFVRQRIIPLYLPVDDPAWPEIAERLLEQFRGREGSMRGALAEDTTALFGNVPNQPVCQGLIRLLEDRCEFSVQAVGAEELRATAFETAAKRRCDATVPRPPGCPGGSARRSGQTSEAIDQGLFADLKSRQKLVSFEDISARRLLERITWHWPGDSAAIDEGRDQAQRHNARAAVSFAGK